MLTVHSQSVLYNFCKDRGYIYISCGFSAISSAWS